MNNKDKLVQYIESLEMTNIKLKDLINIDKVLKDVENVEINLNTLDYIITNNEDEIIKRITILFHKDKSIFTVVPLLVASEIEKVFKINKNYLSFSALINNLDNLIYAFKETGLIRLITSGKIKRFVDYLTGVKVGLDSNARKNRSGKINENDIKEIIENELSKYSFLDIKYQLSGKSIELIKNDDKLKKKKFDVVIKNIKNNKIVFIESSFYNTQGSKVSETARSYSDVYNAIKNYNDYLFIWVADGEGIKSIVELLKEKIELNYLFNKSQFIKYIKEVLNLK